MKLGGPRLVVPEVVQSSAMDCGPAALKCLLAGFGVQVSYGRLREACQTDVDGTSIDTMEEVAVQLGLEAEQVMVPSDHVLLREADALPAIAVTVLPNGYAHFVVIWNRLGPLVQVMDPATGRRWTSPAALRSELYQHAMPVPADDWWQWATSDEFAGPLSARIRRTGLGAAATLRLLEKARGYDGWQGLAALDASTRMVQSLVDAGGLRSGRQSGRLVDTLTRDTLASGERADELVPSGFWSVVPDDDPANVQLRGAVLVRAMGRVERARPTAAELSNDQEPSPTTAGVEPNEDEPEPLSPELVAALDEPPNRPLRDLLGMLRADGLLSPVALALGLLVAASVVTFEALLFRGLLELGNELGLAEQRLAGAGALALFLLLMMALELPLAGVVLRMGRHLEARLRVAFLQKIPLLGDRYFHSRLTSDMAERSHSVHQIRQVPAVGEDLLRATFLLTLTTAGIAWVDPPSGPKALAAALISVVLPLLVLPMLTERDLRVRTHAGALSRFYMDGLLGLVPIRTHGAERAVSLEHESLLTEWARAGISLLRASLVVQGILALAGLGTAAWLVFGYVDRAGGAEGVLLLVYWALNLPTYGGEVAQVARRYPAVRNAALRLMEPLGAPEESSGGDLGGGDAPIRSDAGVEVELDRVTVKAAGHTILSDIALRLRPGEELAVVGPSGAGKSSLVGLLLGWHTPAQGQVLVDGRPLTGAELDRLRRSTAWIDPAVQLWNRSFLNNLRYGLSGDGGHDLARVLRQANLSNVLESLPGGLQTPLGEGGALVSGGEGQRVRLGRAMIRRQVRLAVLDEPFRGLDRHQRRQLLARLRGWWPGATLICITHDVGETLAFPRVVVMEQARIVEDGTPHDLMADRSSRYATLVAREEEVRGGLWTGPRWRHLRMADGVLDEHRGKPS